MQFKQSTVPLILLLMLPLFLNCGFSAKAVDTKVTPDLYFGVDVAFGSIAATEQLIDNVSAYTNFFVIGCIQNYDETKLTTISQYVFSKGLTFIVYTDDTRYPTKQWLQTAQNTWGSSFQGLYFYDEPGGRQLDRATLTVTSAQNYSDAANQYVNSFNWWLRTGAHSIIKSFPSPTENRLFTSDYAFYWYDYKAGYDTLFAEFGANYSQQLNVALCRGAATAFNKDWGVMITWAYSQPPYIESGPLLYSDMVLAYQNGAKYIIIFDSNKDYSASILQQQHLDAMRQFWQYTKENPRTASLTSDRTAYVLPEDYAYGFRGPKDRIWGLWGPDAITTDICMNASALLQKYGANLDIIYPDGPQTIQSEGYQNVYYWNNVPVADTSLSPTPSGSDPPTTTSNPQQGVPLPYVYAIAATILAALGASTVVLKFRNRAPIASN